MLSIAGFRIYSIILTRHWAEFMEEDERLERHLNICLSLIHDKRILGDISRKEAFLSAAIAAHRTINCKNLAEHKNRILEIVQSTWPEELQISMEKIEVNAQRIYDAFTVQ